jgi:hypothetical protein
VADAIGQRPAHIALKVPGCRIVVRIWSSTCLRLFSPASLNPDIELHRRHRHNVIAALGPKDR